MIEQEYNTGEFGDHDASFSKPYRAQNNKPVKNVAILHPDIGYGGAD